MSDEAARASAGKATNVGPVAVGALELMAPREWQFHEFSGLILARRDGGAGTLQISTAFRRDLPEGASVNAAEHLVRQWIGDPRMSFVSLGEAIGVGALDNGCGQAWYSLAPGGLVLAQYQVGSPDTDPKCIDRDLEEVTSIVRSALWRAG